METKFNLRFFTKILSWIFVVFAVVYFLLLRSGWSLKFTFMGLIPFSVITLIFGKIDLSKEPQSKIVKIATIGALIVLLMALTIIFGLGRIGG